jgi:hypothetical protein
MARIARTWTMGAVLLLACEQTAPDHPSTMGGSGNCGPVLAYVDQDGDGFGTGTATTAEACGSSLAAGYAAKGSDCDDDDAEKWLPAYVDEDGDGWGISGPVCVAKIAAGHAPYAGDCDDTSADVHPDAPEQWDDEVDSDCDGEAQPADCGSETCGCERLEAVAISAACAEQPDLGLETITACERCGPETLFVVVGNRGGVDSVAGELRFRSSAGTADSVVPVPPLAPGAATLPLMLKPPAGEITVEVVPASADCTSNNDSRKVSVHIIECR